MDMEKFAGVGLTNIVLIWLVCSLMTILAKTLVLKYEKIPDSVQNVVTSI